MRGTEWSDQDWQLIAETIPHLVWVARSDGYVEYVNRQGTEYTGLTPEDNRGWGWIKVLHPDDADLARQRWTDAVETGAEYSLEYRLRRFDGEYRWNSVRARPMRNVAGEVVKWVGTATDIDDHKRYEERLRVERMKADTANTLLETLQGAAPVGFGYVDREFRYVRLNQELATMNGAPIAEHLGRTAAEMIPYAWKTLEPVHRHVLETGEPVRNLPVRAERIPGHVHDLLTSYYPVRIDGEITGVGVVVVDISAQVQADEWSTLMDQVSDGVLALDPEGRLTYINRAACMMLGWSQEELVGNQVHDLIHFQRPDGTPLSRDDSPILNQARHDRVVGSTGEVFTRKDGSTFPVTYSAMPVRVKPTMPGVAVVFHDASDQRSSPNQIRVLMVDSHVTTSEGLQRLLNEQEGIEVVAAVETSAAAVAAAQRLRPEVVVVDDKLPDSDGVVTTALIKAKVPETSVVLLTHTYSESIAVTGFAAGCASVLAKDRAWVELVSTVRAAYHGEATVSQANLQDVLSTVKNEPRPNLGADLTSRERDVLACLREGCSNAEVGRRLGISPNTVRNHVSRISYKLNVHSKLEAVVVAIRQGLIGDP